MKKLRLLLLFFFYQISTSFSQCPNAQFNASGPGCAGMAINFNNTSSGAAGYTWDFCAGDFDSLMADTSIVSGFLNTPSGLSAVVDSTRNYIFVCSRGDDKLIR